MIALFLGRIEFDVFLPLLFECFEAIETGRMVNTRKRKKNSSIQGLSVFDHYFDLEKNHSNQIMMGR